MVRITLPEDNRQILASRYQLYLPTEEELRRALLEQREDAEGGEEEQGGWIRTEIRSVPSCTCKNADSCVRENRRFMYIFFSGRADCMPIELSGWIRGGGLGRGCWL